MNDQNEQIQQPEGADSAAKDCCQVDPIALAAEWKAEYLQLMQAIKHYFPGNEEQKDGQ